MNTVCLSKAEIQSITGMSQPAKQLEKLLERGFYRAYRSASTGQVILERVHYEAVCSGISQDQTKPRPKVKQINNEVTI